MFSLNKKILAIPALFALLGIVFFPISFSAVLFVCFVFWLLGVFVLPSSLFVARFYWFIFGLFFVVPIVFLGGEEYLLQGALLKEIFLNESQALMLVRLVMVFLVFFMSASFFCSNRMPYQKIEVDLYNYKIFYTLLVVSSLIVIGFNLLEMDAIYNQGYASFQSGELVLKKSFFVLIVEVLFLCLVSLGLSSRNRYCFFALILYAFSLVFTGVRMPGACLAFFGTLYFFPRWRSKFLLILVVSLVVAPPILMFSQALRVYGYYAVHYFDFWDGYYDLISVLGYTIDTLKAAISIENESAVSVSPFFKPLHILTIFLDRVFSVEVDFGYGAFGPEFTKYYDIVLFDRTGTTFGSSSIAEAWYYWGAVGVALVGAASCVISCWFSRVASRGGFFLSLIYIVALPKFVMSVRNEVVGWFFESLIFLMLCVPFVLFCHAVFIRKKHNF